MISLLALHWGQRTVNITTTCDDPASGNVAPRVESGVNTPSAGRGSSKTVGGRGSSKTMKGSGGNG